MKESTYTTRVLTPEEGHYLTQNSEDISVADRIYSTSVYLAASDSPDNWREATEEEYQAWKEQMDKIPIGTMPTPDAPEDPTEEPIQEPTDVTE